MVQKTNPLSSLLKDYGESRIPKIATIEDQEIESSTSSKNESLNNSYGSSEDQIMMTNQPEVKEEYPEDEPMKASASPTNQPPIPNTGAKYNFTIDDIPVSRWSQRFQEFHSWMDTQKLSRESHYDILTEFVSRFTGVLRDWWGTVSPGDQMQFLVQQDFSIIIRVLHTHFLGNQEDVKTLQRKEFFKRKCCSFERRDLEKHYNAMIKLFYALGAEQEDDDVESVFSIEDDLSDQSVFAIQSLEEELEEVETDWSSEAIYMLQHKISTNSSTVPIPHVQAAVYLEKYGKPILIIAFINTGAAMSIMNPNVLPKNWWKPHIRYFTSASD
ncbi:hypothetical protein V6N12_012195 [Hibiscus sabdariffa]|uniref:Polyprotein n=1 Tax=Hibiscus sabdariffa TaxID=183260 RepID=A0ABR2CHE5_9ROSI